MGAQKEDGEDQYEGDPWFPEKDDTGQPPYGGHCMVHHQGGYLGNGWAYRGEGRPPGREYPSKRNLLRDGSLFSEKRGACVLVENDPGEKGASLNSFPPHILMKVL